MKLQAIGIPVIAFDSAQGAKEIIKNGENGFLIENRNINKMAEISYELLNNLTLRKSLGETGRKHVEKYKKENVLKIWIDFLEKIYQE